MWVEEEFVALEEEERNLTDEAIAIMLLLLANVKGNLERELSSFYRKYGQDGIVTYDEARKWISEQDHRRRLTALYLYVSDEFVSALSDIEYQFSRFLADIVGKESTFFGVSVDVDKILTRSWGVDDSYWLSRLTEDIYLWKANINKDIKQAILKGEHIDDILEQLNKRFKSINSVMTTLGLSESTAVGSLSRQDIFKELGVKKYQFYTKDDERRCETCGDMHGRTFPISAFEVGVTASPLHQRCRCWEVPILE